MTARGDRVSATSVAERKWPAARSSGATACWLSVVPSTVTSRRTRPPASVASPRPVSCATTPSSPGSREASRASSAVKTGNRSRGNACPSTSSVVTGTRLRNWRSVVRSICSRTVRSMPSPTESTATSEATPMITPRVESTVRSGLAKRALTPTRRFWPRSVREGEGMEVRGVMATPYGAARAAVSACGPLHRGRRPGFRRAD